MLSSPKNSAEIFGRVLDENDKFGEKDMELARNKKDDRVQD
jgi:hypothetical protein